MKKAASTIERGRLIENPGKLFKSTLNNRLHRNLACVIDKSSRGAKLKRAFEELPQIKNLGIIAQDNQSI